MSSLRADISTADQTITLRLGSASDEDGLAALAALDSSEPPPHPVLLAEVGGELFAALALSDGITIADPFHPTIELVALLRARARQLQGDSWKRRARLGVRLRVQRCTAACFTAGGSTRNRALQATDARAPRTRILP